MNCIICNSNSLIKKIIDIKNLYKNHINLGEAVRNLCICKECLFGFYEDYISDDELELLYKNQYRECNIYKIGNGDLFHRYSYDDRNIAQIMLAKQYYDFKNGGNMIDVGPGAGYSFWTAQNILPSMNYFAVEPGSQSHPHLEKLGVKVFKNTLSKSAINIENNFFDFILMSHSLEHFNSHSLKEVISILYTKLKKTGVLIIEVPFFEIPEQHGDKNGTFLPDPTHLSFFTIESLNLLLKQNQFDVKFISACGKHYESIENVTTESTTKNERTKNNNSFKNKIINNVPQKIKNILHSLKAFSTGYNIYDILHSEANEYSPDRTQIRAVAVK